jgi:hypothetical protein
MTPVESSPELLTLHAVRLKGMADDGEVAARFGLDPTVASEFLLDFQAMGWVTRVDFAGTGGWTLTDSGKAGNERQLAQELAATGLRSIVHDACLDFLPQTSAYYARPQTGSCGPVGQIRLPRTTMRTPTGTSGCSTSCRRSAKSSGLSASG